MQDVAEGLEMRGLPGQDEVPIVVWVAHTDHLKVFSPLTTTFVLLAVTSCSARQGSGAPAAAQRAPIPMKPAGAQVECRQTLMVLDLRLHPRLQALRHDFRLASCHDPATIEPPPGPGSPRAASIAEALQ